MFGGGVMLVEHGTTSMVRQQKTQQFAVAEYSYLNEHTKTIKYQDAAGKFM